MSIEIKAIRCNNKKECLNGEDEQECDQETIPLVTSLGIGFILSLLIASLTVYCINLNIVKKINDMFEDPEDAEDQSASISKQVLIQQCQPEERKEKNRKYFQNLIDSNGGKRDEALNKIRLQLGPSFTENFMKDIQEDEEEEEDQTEEVSFVDKVQSFFTSFTDKALKNFQR